MGKSSVINLFSPNIIFSDLKPNNVGLTSRGDVRLFDFGRSMEVKSPTIITRQTAEYTAPEVFQRKPAGGASDRYSYGGVMSHLYQEKLPFSEEAAEKLYDSIKDDDPRLTNDVDYIFEMKRSEGGKTNRLKLGYAIQQVIAEGKWDVDEIKSKKAKKLVMDCLKLNPDDRPHRLAAHKFFKNASRIPSFTPSVIASTSEVPTVMNCVIENDEIRSKLQEHTLRIPTQTYFGNMMKASPTDGEFKNPAAGDAPMMKQTTSRILKKFIRRKR